MPAGRQTRSGSCSGPVPEPSSPRKRGPMATARANCQQLRRSRESGTHEHRFAWNCENRGHGSRTRAPRVPGRRPCPAMTKESPRKGLTSASTRGKPHRPPAENGALSAADAAPTHPTKKSRMNEKNPDSLPADALSARPVQTGDGAPDPAPAEATPAPAPAEAPPAPAPAPSPAALDAAIARAAKALIAEQQADGHWVFELEADCTIPAEYVLLQHYLGEGDRLGVEEKIAAYLYRTQLADGGWPLVHEGGFDISASVKAYFALKMIGEDPESEPMRRARAAILAHGGAARVNVFTRVLLALYGILGWHAVPVMPVEIMLLPRRFPFHLSKIS